MSIEVYVFPTTHRKIEIGELEDSAKALLASRLPCETLPDQLILSKPLSSELCVDGSFQITMGRSLFLYMWQNDENQLYFLEGQASNISRADLEMVARQNESVGYHFNLDSKMGRFENECFVMLSVAASLAKLTNGLVLVADNPIENLQIGGYWADQVVQKIMELKVTKQ